jgi:alanine racemase
MRPTWVEIDLHSIKTNLNTVKGIIGDNVSILAIVKADAYGHGAVTVSKILINNGVEILGVATLEEGMELRESGINHPVIILGGIQKDELDDVIKNSMIPTIYDIGILEELSNAAKKINKNYSYHLKIDTGMNRLGIKHENLDLFFENHARYNNLRLEGLFTHLSMADEITNDYTNMQINLFFESLNTFRKLNIDPEYFHLANSAAIQNFPESHGNLVRPGIMIYGEGSINGYKLSPVMKLKSKIIQLKSHDKGASISYGGTYVTDKKSLIATVPIGYADGYLRILSNRAFVSLNGKRAPVVGSVCMDFVMIDVTKINNVKVGDVVTLFGDGNVSLNDVAGWADTIPYEIMTLVGKRVHRLFV